MQFQKNEKNVNKIEFRSLSVKSSFLNVELRYRNDTLQHIKNHG